MKPEQKLNPVKLMRIFNDLYNTCEYIRMNINTLSFFDFMYPIYFVDADLKMTVYEDFQFLDEYILKFCSHGMLHFEELKKYIAIPGDSKTLKERVDKLEVLGLIIQKNGIYHLSEMGKKSVEDGRLVYIRPKEEVGFKSLLQIDGLTNQAITYDKRFSANDFNKNKKNNKYMDKPRLNLSLTALEERVEDLKKSIIKSFELGELNNLVDPNVNCVGDIEFRKIDYALTECIYDSSKKSLVGFKYGRYNQVELHDKLLRLCDNDIIIYLKELPTYPDGIQYVIRTTNKIVYFDVLEKKAIDSGKYKYAIKIRPRYPRNVTIKECNEMISKENVKLYYSSVSPTYGTISGNPIEIDMDNNRIPGDLQFEFEFYNKQAHKTESRKFITNAYVDKEKFSGIINKVLPFKLTKGNEVVVEVDKFNDFYEKYEYDVLLTIIEMKILNKNNNYFFVPLVIDEENEASKNHYCFRLILSCSQNYSSYKFSARYILLRYVYLRIVYLICNKIINGNNDEKIKKEIRTLYLNEQYEDIILKYNESYKGDMNCYDNFKSSIKKLIDGGSTFSDATTQLLSELKPEIMLKTNSSIQ